MKQDKVLKIAIIHEMLIKIGGAEKVVEKLIDIFPKADLFTLIYDEEKVGQIFPKNKINKQVFKLKSQKIYNFTKNQRFCLTSMPSSIEKLDFSKYDIVIGSSSGFAHGAITKPETKFIVYYHSPARYLWDWTNEYKKDIGWSKGIKGFILNKIFLKLRIWDYIASQRVDLSIANSSNVAKRIKKYYGKESHIIYPNVEINRFKENIEKNPSGGYYLIVSALTEFKKIDIAINAFKKLPDFALKIVGQGNYQKNLEELATKEGHYSRENNNIKFLGAKYGEDLVKIVQGCKGLIFPGEEDFGIVPIEAMAAGKPVFAYNGGGLKETNIEGITGSFFNDKNGSDFIDNFINFNKNIDNNIYKKEAIQKHAEKFDEIIFEEKIKQLVYN